MKSSKRVIRAPQANQVFIDKYRRNRKMQSCEPCRRAKVGCDHSIPCGRCVRKGCVDDCYYHPSPLTRPRRQHITSASQELLSPPGLNCAGSSYSIDQFRTVDDPKLATTSQGYHNGADLVRPQPASSTPPLVDDRSGNPQGMHGFLGFTSHTSIMTEDLMQLGMVSTDLEQAIAVHKQQISDEKIVSGCQILAFLQNGTMIDRGIDMFFDCIECIHIHCGEFIMRQWISELWSAHGETLSSQDPDQIRQLCQLLFENTATPLVFDGHTTVKQWISSATGDHIRWGVIAMIANYVGSYTMVTKSSDPFFREFKVERKSLLQHMAKVSEVCIGFCREFGALDDVFISALFEHYNITQYTNGGMSYAAYCLGAELNSAFIAMGLHQEIKADSRLPFFLAELRKRLRALVYTAEISTATFLGRPPRLAHRYTNLDPPLDLTDSQLFSEYPQELDSAISKLDEQGYNQDGEIHHLSWIRSSLDFTKRREDILELSLGNYSPDEVRQNASVIQQRTEQHWANLPHFISSLRQSTSGLETWEPIDLHFRNIFRQGPQANLLLLHRVLMRKAGSGPAELIQTAQSILSDVMRLYKRVEISETTSFIYFLTVHGLRSAVILAMELLKQDQLPVYPEEPLLPRSRTIQDLSIFSAKLSDLDPIFGDKDLCEKGQKVISRVLDKILSPPKTAGQPCHTCLMQTQQLDTITITDNTSHNIHVPERLVARSGISYDMNVPILGADHEFRLWLESIDSQEWPFS